MYKCISLLFCLALLISCKKNNQPLNLSGNYISSNIAVVTGTGMYTKTGLITDWSKMYQFLNTQGITREISDIKQKTLINDVAKITIDANGYATVDLHMKNISTRVTFSGLVEDLNTGDFVIRASKPDSVSSIGKVGNDPIQRQIAPRSYYVDPWGNISDKPFDGGVTLNPSFIPINLNISTKKQLLIIKDNELYLPMLMYSYQKKTDYATQRQRISEYSIYNLLNPNVQSALADRDTVVAQQFLIKLIKQP
jgi:hypothetical protein